MAPYDIPVRFERILERTHFFSELIEKNGVQEIGGQYEASRFLKGLDIPTQIDTLSGRKEE
jgi:hypothetical protein